MLTGTLALTAFWSALADERANCPVSDAWSESCACPAPPQPYKQLELAVWDWLLLWLVLASLPALLFALLSAFWVALLLPP